MQNAFEKVRSRKFGEGEYKFYLSISAVMRSRIWHLPSISAWWLSRLHRACPSVFLDNNLFKERGKYKNKNEKTYNRIFGLNSFFL